MREPYRIFCLFMYNMISLPISKTVLYSRQTSIVNAWSLGQLSCSFVMIYYQYSYSCVIASVSFTNAALEWPVTAWPKVRSSSESLLSLISRIAVTFFTAGRDFAGDGGGLSVSCTLAAAWIIWANWELGSANRFAGSSNSATYKEKMLKEMFLTRHNETNKFYK